ncbi:MAG TPA: hypothetical protein DEB35_03030 [Desulfuromonas sp.]|nr:hypothetical protein [Desulfuromonas sp.]
MSNLVSLSTAKAAEAGVEISILHPVTDEPLGVMITVYGADSKTCRQIQRRQTNHRLEMQAKQKQQFKKKPVTTAEQLEAEGLDLLVGCTKSWRTLIYDEEGKETGSRPQIEMAEGEWLDCTPENVRKLYQEIPWVKEQIDGEIGDRSNFLQS